MSLSKCVKCGGEYYRRVFVVSLDDKHRGHYEDLCLGCYEKLSVSGIEFKDHVPVPEHVERCCGGVMLLQWRIGRNRDGSCYGELSFYECGVCGKWVITEEVKNWDLDPQRRRISFKRFGLQELGTDDGVLKRIEFENQRERERVEGELLSNFVFADTYKNKKR